VFADSLTCVRTGMVGGHRTEAEQCISQEMFLREAPRDSEWDPNSIQIQKQSLLIYNKIKKWQGNPILYEEEIRRFWRQRDV
jgi:hypothetical protein